MQNHVLLVVALLVTIFRVGQAGEPRTDEKAAREVAQSFILAALKEDPAPIRDFIAAPEMAHEVFGDEAAHYSSADLEQVSRGVVQMGVLDLSNAFSRKLMGGGNVQPELQVRSRDSTGLVFTVIIINGKGESVEFVVVARQVTEKWKVVDFGVPSGMHVAELRKMYKKSGSRNPVEWIQQAVKAHEQTNIISARVLALKQDGTTLPTTVPVRRSTTEYATAADAMNKYIALFQQGKAGEALEWFWDLDRFLNMAFGADYNQLADAEKDRCKAMLLEYLKLAPEIGLQMETSHRANQRLKDSYELSEGRTVAVVIIEAPDSALTLRFYLWQAEDGVKIYDQSTKVSSLAESWTREYRRIARDIAPKVTPLHFMESKELGMKLKTQPEKAAR